MSASKRFYDVAIPFLDVAEKALGAAPLPGVSAIAAGLKVILEKMRSIQEEYEEGRQFVAEIQRLGVFIQQTLRSIESNIKHYDEEEANRNKLRERINYSSEIQSRVRNLQKTIDELQVRPKLFRGGLGPRGFFKRFWYGSRNRKLMEEMKTDLNTAMQNFDLQGSITMAKAIEGIRESLREERDQDILQRILCLPPDSAWFLSVDERKGGFMQGTRTELFVDLDQWTLGKFPPANPKQIYLTSGGAGLGKTSIAHELCTRRKKKMLPSASLGASFFFDRSNENLAKLLLLPSTLAYQLAVSQRSLRRYIIDAADQYNKDGGGQSFTHAFKSLLSMPLTAATKTMPPPILLVIDGIDECLDDWLVPEVLSSFFALASECSWLYIFLTCRPEQRIIKALTDFHYEDSVHHCPLEENIEKWSGDVRKYLEAEVPKIPEYSAYLGRDPNALERLIRRAGGVFIFARVAVEYLKAHRDSRPEQWFSHLLLGAGGALKPLDELYLQILRSAHGPEELRSKPPALSELEGFSSEMQDAQWDLFHRYERLQSLLRFIALAHEPTRPDTIAFLESRAVESTEDDTNVQPHIVAFRKKHDEMTGNDVEDWVNRILPVLIVDKSDRVATLHNSFRDFLVNPTRCPTGTAYSIAPLSGHAHLTCLCLSAISFKGVTDMLLWLSHPSTLPEPPLGYAVPSGWRIHLERAKYDHAVEKKLSSFVRGPGLAAYTVWMLVSGEREEEHAGQLIWNYLEPSPRQAEICSQYLKLSLYVRRWWACLPHLRDRALRRLGPEDVARSIRLLNFCKKGIPEEINLFFGEDDHKRYKAIMDEFVAEMEQDERTKRLWDRPRSVTAASRPEP